MVIKINKSEFPYLKDITFSELVFMVVSMLQPMINSNLLKAEKELKK